SGTTARRSDVAAHTPAPSRRRRRRGEKRAGRPPRGCSASPGRRQRQKRLRHLLTICRGVSRRAAMASLASPAAARSTILARITSRYGDVYLRARASRSRRSATLNSTRYGLVRGIVPGSSLATQSARTYPDSGSNIRHRTYVTEYLARGRG